MIISHFSYKIKCLRKLFFSISTLSSIFVQFKQLHIHLTYGQTVIKPTITA